MAKMFYTLEEAAKRLGVGTEKVREMASSGQLQEFRDRDSLVFKVEQVNLLAGGEEDGPIPLAGGSGGSGLELSLEDSGGGSGALEIDDGGAKGKSGISIFDTEELEQADPSAVTRITETTQGELTLESVGSGSGLLDLTREADDTSLGADLVGDVYSGDKGQEETQGTSGLFETTPTAGDGSGSLAPALAMVAAEPYDGAGSGWTGGLAFGAMAALALSIATVLLAIVGMSGGMVIDFVRSSEGNGLWFVVGGAGALMAVAAVVGLVLGKRS